MALLAAWLGLPRRSAGLWDWESCSERWSPSFCWSFRQRGETRKTWALSKLPLGTFLCIGGIVSSLWGQPILAAYLRWAGF